MMRVLPVSLAGANERVVEWHRHHKKVVGHKFSLGAYKDGPCVGVLIAGRPVARNTDQRLVLEVTRLATDGTKNACSFLLAAAARAAQAMGFNHIQTFTSGDEEGGSLKGAGWVPVGLSKRSPRGRKPGCFVSAAEIMAGRMRPTVRWEKPLNPPVRFVSAQEDAP